MKCVLVLVTIFRLASACPLNSENVVASLSEPLSEIAAENKVQVVAVKDDVGKESEVAAVAIAPDLEKAFVNDDADLTRKRRCVECIFDAANKVFSVSAGGFSSGIGSGGGSYHGTSVTRERTHCVHDKESVTVQERYWRR